MMMKNACSDRLCTFRIVRTANDKGRYHSSRSAFRRIGEDVPHFLEADILTQITSR